MFPSKGDKLKQHRINLMNNPIVYEQKSYDLT